jgi:hypothetical protein
MSIVTREGKGSRLTTQEMDGNFTYLEGLAQSGSMGPGYKEFIALLSTQSETDPLDIIVLKNTLGEITSEWEDIGSYLLTGDDLFTIGKTHIQFNSLTNDTTSFSFFIDANGINRVDSKYIRINSQNGGGLLYIPFTYASLEIKVFP